MSDNNWVDEIIKMADEHVVLNEKSKEYNIDYAAKKLEQWYISKINGNILHEVFFDR